MENKNNDLLETIEMALELAEEIQAANKTQNLDVGYLKAAREIAFLRAAHLKKVAANRATEKKAKADAAAKQNAEAEAKEKAEAEAKLKADSESKTEPEK